jgi:YidC/Oxa1 family membrane protein insertase
LEANKVKNKDKKPSGFGARLQDAMRAAQERDASTARPGIPDSDADAGTSATVEPKAKKPTRRK